MAKFTITINTDNDATQDEHELARILDEVKADLLNEKFSDYFTDRFYKDINGNQVGIASFELDDVCDECGLVHSQDNDKLTIKEF